MRSALHPKATVRLNSSIEAASDPKRTMVDGVTTILGIILVTLGLAVTPLRMLPAEGARANT